MEIKKLINGRALYLTENEIWVAKGATFFAVDETGRRVSKKYKVGTFKTRVLSGIRIIRQTLREGIHHLLILKNGNFFVTTKKKSYTVDRNTGKVISVFWGYRGNKPAHQGVCLTPSGTIFFGEYTLNPDRSLSSDLYVSDDNGITFKKIKSFSGKEVRHIHFVKYDPYRNGIWLGTGDEDRENKLLFSGDGGKNFVTVGEGSQSWRAIGVAIKKGGLCWGTDAGSVPDTNRFLTLDLTDGIGDTRLNAVSDLEGPCHGVFSTAAGEVWFSCGVEGGENEKDRFARLKRLNADKTEDVFKLKKDIFPLICQYGVMRFPLGGENGNTVAFTAMGLKGGGEKVFIVKNH